MTALLRPAWTTLVFLVPLAVVQAVAAEPLLAPPLAASAALVATTPDAPPARPSAVLLGHLVSVAAGLAAAFAAGPGPLAATVAAGVSVAAMVAAKRFHAPAVASAALAGIGGALMPAAALLAGAAAIVGLAALPRLLPQSG
ncbi:HPP family protein [Actinomadura macrotermitis]|uniref:HPP transmembrane region domain-containing protein n=1 Tax=Actinomadura macrotermitis TaxID=2585200 RepID=A0A7K0C280_9ACTN|nr:HPP family protein [Actinomadura macrotermitis]MQY07486.1 hypothetical protein [Actinomadura macrotermitis]